MTKQTLPTLQQAFPGLTHSEFRGQTRVVVPLATTHQVLRVLKEQLGFDLLVDITCVDYLHYRDAVDRFGLVYLLANTVTSERLIVRTMLMILKPHVPTAVDLWERSHWLERKCGTCRNPLDGHPDLRRILLPDEFTAHPLRKDYPLQGRGERHNFPVITRRES